MTRPAPILRWPTSELPIWPLGSPTERSEASMVVCELLPEPIPIRFTGEAHRIVGRRIAAAYAVEYHQQNRDHGVDVGHGGRRRNGGIGWRANVDNPSDTLSFYLRPCAVLGFHCIPHAIHSE